MESRIFVPPPELALLYPEIQSATVPVNGARGTPHPSTIDWKALVNLFCWKYVGGFSSESITLTMEGTCAPERPAPRRTCDAGIAPTASQQEGRERREERGEW